MFFVAKNILNEDSDAEDAVQEAFLKITRILEKINDPECHKSLFYFVIMYRTKERRMWHMKKRMVRLVAILASLMEPHIFQLA